jgi:hypothetical protein
MMAKMFPRGNSRAGAGGDGGGCEVKIPRNQSNELNQFD